MWCSEEGLRASGLGEVHWLSGCISSPVRSAKQNCGTADCKRQNPHLIQEVADVVIAEPLGLQQLVQVGLHETLNDVDIFHVLLARGAQDVADVDHVLVVEPCQDLDLS